MFDLMPKTVSIRFRVIHSDRYYRQPYTFQQYGKRMILIRIFYTEKLKTDTKEVLAAINWLPHMRRKKYVGVGA